MKKLVSLAAAGGSDVIFFWLKLMRAADFCVRFSSRLIK